jgi:hypothetical protein
VPGDIGTIKLPANVKPLSVKKFTATSRGITAGYEPLRIPDLDHKSEGCHQLGSAR